MPSYAANYTPRYKVSYVSAGVTHTVQVRGPRGATLSDMQTIGDTLHDFFGPFATILPEDFEWVAASIALTDDDLFTPADVPAAVAGTQVVADYEPKQKVIAGAFSGRALGSRSRLYVYGARWDALDTPDDNAVVTAGEYANIGTAVAVANANYHAGSGALAVWYPRATIKENDHLLKLVRRGTIS